MEDRFVLDSPALEAAVKYRSQTEHPKKRPAKNSLQEEFTANIYDGFFSVQIVDGTISVINAGAPESGIAGYFYMNGEFRDAKSAHGITLKKGFLCLKNGVTELHGSFEILDHVPSKPSLYGKPDYHPLAIIRQEGTNFSIQQISKWEIPQLWIFAECETEEENGNE